MLKTKLSINIYLGDYYSDKEALKIADEAEKLLIPLFKKHKTVDLDRSIDLWNQPNA